MPVHLREVVGYLDKTLEIDRFKDYAPNGLQVEGALEVERIVTGVSASAELIGRAVELGADLIVVHHGLMWGGGLTKIAGPIARRLKLLLGNDVSLAAYHLPLDKHARLGNNAGLARCARARTAARSVRRRPRDRARARRHVVAAAVEGTTRSRAIAGGVCNGAAAALRVPVRSRRRCARSACAPARRAICSRRRPPPVATCS